MPSTRMPSSTRDRTTMRATAWLGGLASLLLGLGSAAAQAPAVPAIPVEPDAVALLKAAGDALATAKGFTVTATAVHEAANAEGQVLFYTQRSRISFQRPDRLRVRTVGDGHPSLFVTDGKTMATWKPIEGTLASASVTGGIDGVLKSEAEAQGQTLAFADLVLSDPARNLTEGLTRAFVVGRSTIVGGVQTDIVAFADATAQAQIWIGSRDRLPRQMVVTLANEPGKPRNLVTFSNWRLNPSLPARTFTIKAPASARIVPFPSPGT